MNEEEVAQEVPKELSEMRMAWYQLNEMSYLSAFVFNA